MKINVEMFQTDGVLDNRAIKGGVYFWELVDKKSGNSKPLYIGESAWCVSRCGNHLYRIEQSKGSYFGLLPEDLNNENLILRVSLLEAIDKIKSENRTYYEERELEYIKKIGPLTQNKENDNMIRGKAKTKRVQDAIKKAGFKA